MRKLKLCILSLLLYFILGGNGCNRRVYDSLINYNCPTPIIFETVKDNNKVNKFLGADFGYSKGSYSNEDIALLRLNFNYASNSNHSFSNTSIISYTGFYIVKGLGPKQESNFTDIDYNGRKWGAGLLGNLKLGLNFKFTNFKLGSGIDILSGVETGEFLDFRNSASERGIIESENQWASISINLFLFGSYQLSNSALIILQFNIGKPGTFSPIISYQVNEKALWFSYNVKRANLGIMTNFESIF